MDKKLNTVSVSESIHQANLLAKNSFKTISGTITILPFGLCVLCSVLSANPAQAGQWSFMIDAVASSGTATGESWIRQVEVGEGEEAPPPYLYTSSESTVGPASTSGTIVWECKWTPDGPTDLPPTNPSFLVDSNATANVIFPKAGTASSTLDNGLGLDSPKVESVIDLTPDLKQYDATSSGKRVIRLSQGIQNADGSFSWRIPISASAASNGTDPSARAASILTNVVNDTRSVTLTRSGAPTALPEKIVVNNAWVDNPDLLNNKNRYEWVEADGTGHGHSITSYSERSLVTDEAHDDPIDVIHTINASRTGAWSPVNQLSYEWKPGVAENIVSTGDTSWDESKVLSEHRDYQIRQMVRSDAINNPDGVWTTLFPGAGDPRAEVIPGTEGWINIPSDKAGEVVDFKYKLKDLADSATAIGKYHMTLHDVWEGEDEDPRFPLAANVTTANPAASGVSYEDYYYVPAGAMGNTRENITAWEIEQNTTYKVNLKASFQLGFKIKDWANASGSAEISRDLEITQNMKSGAPSLAVPPVTNPPTPDPYNLGPDARFLTVVVYNAKRVHKLVNNFGPNGLIPYSGTQSPIFAKSDKLWGRVPQSKIDDLTAPRADWYPYHVLQGAPADESTGTWTKSGTFS